jgi:quercetin dioxygenase-like cupin family protein/DNA-binding XRE family transcriptional regulator
MTTGGQVSPDVVPALGERIREERLKRGVGLRQLARAVGVSPSFISQIETAKSQPSVSTLYAITSALGISIEDVFDSRPALRDGDVTAAGAAPGVPRSGVPAAGTAGRATGVLDALGALRGQRFGPVVRASQRQILTLDSGVTWERLGHLPRLNADFLLVTYAPGGSSSSTGTLMRHSGSEYGFVLSGKLVLRLGFEEFRLAPGDAISFDSTTPHSYRNDGNEPAVCVFFVVEQT